MDRKAFLTPERCFLILVILIQAINLATLSPLRTQHGAERFLHVVNYAMGLRGTPDQVPLSLLEMIRNESPPKLTGIFPEQVKEWDRLVGKQNYFFDPTYQGYAKERKLRKPRPKIVDVLGKWNLPLDLQTTVPFHTTQTAANRSILGSAPFLAAALTGLTMEMSPWRLVYFMIVTNLIVTIALGYWLIRVTPVMKWGFAYILLLPAVCVQRSYVMPDIFNAELCYLTIALVLRWSAESKMLSCRKLMGLVLLSWATAIMKVAYFLIPAIALMLPKDCFRSTRFKYIFVGAVLIMSVGIGIGWGVYAAEDVYKIDLQQTQDVPKNTQDASYKFHLQLDYLLQNPGGYVVAMVESFWTRGGIRRWMENICFWGSRIHLDPQTMHLVIYGAMLALAALALFPAGDDASFRMTRAARLICLGVFFAVFATVTTIYYLGHSSTFENLRPLFFDEIGYMQGRFLLPALPLAFLAAYRFLPLSEKNTIIAKRAALAWALMTLGVMHWLVFARYV